MSNPVVQFQIVAADPDGVAHFYRNLFGWKVAATNALGYRQVETGDGGINGGVWPAPPGAHSFVQLFVAVADVEDSVARATQLGAKIIVPITALPDGDTMAILADPSGLTFGLTQRGRA